jgi:predicted O-methyltransferase YrrM
MTDNHFAAPVPPLVTAAQSLAAKRGFSKSSIPEVGRLLRALSARTGISICEIGTGCGVGSAWMIDGLKKDSTLITVESDPSLVTAVQSLFRDALDVVVAEGDWKKVLPGRGPFDLLFADGGGWKRDIEGEAPLLVALVKPGGLILMDDMTPEHLWPQEWREHGDPVRNFFYEHSGVHVAEILTTETTAALIVAVR